MNGNFFLLVGCRFLDQCGCRMGPFNYNDTREVVHQGGCNGQVKGL